MAEAKITKTESSAGAGDATATNDEAANTEPREFLKVSSFAPRFCRAGLRFTREPTLILLDDLSEEQLASLENEPHLKTVRV